MSAEFDQQMRNELGTRKLLLAWTIEHTPDLQSIIGLLQHEVDLYEQIVAAQKVCPV